MRQPNDHTVDLYLRVGVGGSAARQQGRARERVRSLDTVTATSVTEWVGQVALDHQPATTARQALDGVTEWARRRGVRLHPSFETRTRCADEVGGRYRALVLPVVTLVVRDGDSVRCVFPHRDGDEFRTVEDALDGLEAGRLPATADPDREPAAAD